MTSPSSSAAANLPRTVTHSVLCTVTAVDTVTGVCSIDPGDGEILDEVLYLGPAPRVGAQVVKLMFRSTSVVLGGTG